MTRAEIEAHNARVEAEWEANRDERESADRAEVDRQWKSLGYTDDPQFDVKCRHLASIAYEAVSTHPNDCRDDHDTELMGLPGSRRHDVLHYGEWKVYRNGKVADRGRPELNRSF